MLKETIEIRLLAFKNGRIVSERRAHNTVVTAGLYMLGDLLMGEEKIGRAHV